MAQSARDRFVGAEKRLGEIRKRLADAEAAEGGARGRIESIHEAMGQAMLEDRAPDASALVNEQRRVEHATSEAAAARRAIVLAERAVEEARGQLSGDLRARARVLWLESVEQLERVHGELQELARRAGEAFEEIQKSKNEAGVGEIFQNESGLPNVNHFGHSAALKAAAILESHAHQERKREKNKNQ